jgi:hypothetical protein
LCLSTHSTHNLQPLDKRFSKSLKLPWSLSNLDEVQRREENNQTAIWTTSLQSLGKSATNGNSVSGLKATGIHPLDPSAIPEHPFFVSKTR